MADLLTAAEPIEVRSECEHYRAMTNTEFWALVDKIAWPTRGYKNLGLSDWEKSEGRRIAKHFRTTLQGVLQAKSFLEYGSLWSWPQLSDDSYWDFTAHIVGLGEETYHDLLSNPDKTDDYIKKGYKENFEYCFS